MLIIKQLLFFFSRMIIFTLYILGSIYPIHFILDGRLIIPSFIHIFGTAAFIVLWTKYIFPYHYNTTKAPIVILIATWYAFGFTYLFEPFPFTSFIVLLLIASITLLWSWDEFKKELFE